MQRRQLVVGAGIARDQVQAVHRHVEAGAVGVLQGHEFGGLAAGLEGLQPSVAAHPVGLVNHRCAGAKLREVADRHFARVGGLLAAPALANHLAVELGLADHREIGALQPEPGVDLPLGDRQTGVGGQEIVEAVDVGRA